MNRVGLAVTVAIGLLGAHGAKADEASCSALKSRAIAADAIGLPTSGAKVTAATWIPAKAPMPAYCKVTGAISPVDPHAPPIQFELNLPEGWNKKAVQFGGGGFNGTVVTGLGRLRDGPPDVPVPLAQGYITFGSDSGHDTTGKPDMQVFAWNAEALDNFFRSAIKKTHDTAMALVVAYYGEKPRKTYYFGGSQGGREAMNAVQNYPADYDGAVATVPVIGWVGLESAAYQQWEAVYANNWSGRPTEATLALLRKATLDVCDGMDGLKDGVVAHYEACKGPNLELLACAKGKAGDDCLTPGQMEWVRRVHAPFKYGFTVVDGAADYPGWMWGAGETLENGIDPWMVSKGAPQLDQARRAIGVGFARYLIMRDPSFTGPLRVADYKALVTHLAAAANMTNPDLSAFAAKGGKLIMKENASDYTQNPREGFAYYKAVAAKMGKAKVDGFVRLYVNPGVDHGGSGKQLDGSAIPDKVDLLGALDAWADKGEAPGILTVAAYDGDKPGATRPLCLYPDWPRYDGKGDPKAASSFACVR